MEELERLRAEIDEIDDAMAALFARRMRAAAAVAAYKQKHGLPVLNTAREEQVLAKGAQRIQDETLRLYYTDYQRYLMELSRRYQHSLLKDEK